MRPENEEELSGMVRAAAFPLRIMGGGTRDIGKPLTGAALSMSAMTGITLYEPGALTLVARAGTPLADVEGVLAREGQRLAFEPPDMRALLSTQGVPSVGGMVAANASGPRRVQAGACRDSLIGVRFVDGTGAVIKNGGRVMKNVTGYDLVKLMAGSWGTLGILTECSFKLLPVPETQATLCSAPMSIEDAGKVMSAAMGTPYEVTGAARTPDGHVYLRVEGFERQVSYRCGQLRDVLGGAWDILDAPASAAQWLGIRDVRAFAECTGDVWRISLQPSAAPAVLARGDWPVIMDWAGGLLWVLTPEGVDLRAQLGEFAGHATLVRGSQVTRTRLSVFPPQSPPLAAISQGIRQKFDPRGVLNPGLTG